MMAGTWYCYEIFFFDIYDLKKMTTVVFRGEVETMIFAQLCSFVEIPSRYVQGQGHIVCGHTTATSTKQII